MKKLFLILFLPIILNAQSILLWNGSESSYYAIDLDGSTEYAYINNPTGLDLNSPNYVADSNSIFTGTVTSDWTANGNVSISFPSNNMQFVNTTSTSSDYVALSQDNLTSTLENGKNYTVQFDASSVGSSDLAVKVGNGHGADMPRTYTISSGSPTINGDTIDFNNEGSGIYDNNYWEVGKKYKINATVTNYSGSGNIVLPYDGGAGGDIVMANGNYEYTYSPQSVAMWIYSYAGHTATVTVNSIEEVGTTISTTGTNATYAYTFKYDSTGMTAVNPTEWQDSSYWDELHGWKIENNKIVCGNNSSTIYKGNTWEVGKPYLVKVYVDAFTKGSFKLPYDGGALPYPEGTPSYVGPSASDSLFTYIYAPNSTYMYLYNNNDCDATISALTIEELPSIQFLPQSNDTYTVDNVEIVQQNNQNYDVWFKPANVSGIKSIFDYGEGSSGRTQLYMNNNDIIFLMEDINGASTNQIIESSALADNWYHFVIDIDLVGQTWDAKLNDVAKTQKDWSGLISMNFLSQTNTVSLGRANSGSDYFNGELGQVSINNNLSTWKVLNGDWIYVNLTIDDIIKYTGGYK